MSHNVERGSCFCGAITAELTGDPFWICYDHDADCRRAIGAAVVVWIGYHPRQLGFLTGSPRSFSKTRGVVRTFCADCGSSISYADDALPDEVYLTLGFIDHPERFQPQAHAYWQERLPWVSFADHLPRIEGYSRPRDAALGAPRDRQ
jgi:hypothetical protein